MVYSTAWHTPPLEVEPLLDLFAAIGRARSIREEHHQLAKKVELVELEVGMTSSCAKVPADRARLTASSSLKSYLLPISIEVAAEAGCLNLSPGCGNSPRPGLDAPGAD